MAIIRKSAGEAAETARVNFQHLEALSQVEIKNLMIQDGEDPEQPFKGLRITTKKSKVKTVKALGGSASKTAGRQPTKKRA